MNKPAQSTEPRGWESPSGAVGAPMHPREAERLAALNDYRILDTEHEATFDHLVALATEFTDTPLGAISFVDLKRQWFKASQGLEVSETDRNQSFCAHAILGADPVFTIPDAMKDPRFANNPLVTGEPGIRFYTGVPINTPDGLPLGSLCVIDRKPRKLTAAQDRMLQHLAQIAAAILESRRHTKILEDHVLFAGSGPDELPVALEQLVTARGALHSGLSHLLQDYIPLLPEVAARIRQIGASRTVWQLPEDAEGPRRQDAWAAFDSNQPKDDATHEDTVQVGEMAYLASTIPLSFHGQVFARVDFICPDPADLRMRSAFKLLLSSFSLLADREIRTTELKFQVGHDSLTGAASRVLLLAEVDRALQRTQGTNPTQVLFNIHLGSLIEVNDNYGHAAGDAVLVELARRLRGVHEGRNFVARIAGNDFVMLAWDLDPNHGLSRIFLELRHCVEKPFQVPRGDISLNSDLGCAIFNDAAVHPVEMLRRAEVAMRYASSQDSDSQNEIYTYNDALLRQRKQMNRDNLAVRQAFADNQLFQLFQPIVNLQSGKLCGAEALLRMKDQSGKAIETACFIPAVERIRHQSAMDEWAFNEVRHEFSPSGVGLPLRLDGDFHLSLNATPSMLAKEGLAARWLSQLADSSIPPSFLTLEIIENPLLHESDALIKNLHTFRAAGMRVAVDDFGSGYSNLRHLADLPVDIVKLDRSLLIEAGDSMAKGRALLPAIIAMCHGLGYIVQAEGVETAEQEEFLRANGCDYAQGFFYGKPVPLTRLLKLHQS